MNRTYRIEFKVDDNESVTVIENGEKRPATAKKREDGSLRVSAPLHLRPAEKETQTA